MTPERFLVAPASDSIAGFSIQSRNATKITASILNFAGRNGKKI